MHDTAYRFARQHAGEHGPYGRVIEFGSLDINGSPRRLFPGDVDYLGVDVQAGPGVDLVRDVTELAEEPADLVVCMEVLEHAPAKAGIIAAAARHLVPGGHLILTAACDPRAPHSAIDEQPIRVHEFYANVDPDWLSVVLVETGWTICGFDTSVLGDVYVCAVRP